MRKIYSLVLMATMLLIGTNAWADVHATLVDGVDEAKVSKDGGNTWQYATSLKDAFDYVGYGETAEIVLLRSINVEAPITMPGTIPTYANGKGRLHEVDGQNITLNLNGKNITTTTNNVTPFRILKGSLDIEGSGIITKEHTNRYKVNGVEKVYGEPDWYGGAIVAISGAQDSLAADWSVLTIGKDVMLQFNRETGSDGKVLKSKAIAITNFAGLGWAKKATGTDAYNGTTYTQGEGTDFLARRYNALQTETSALNTSLAPDQIDKFGYATRITKNIWNGTEASHGEVGLIEQAITDNKSTFLMGWGALTGAVTSGDVTYYKGIMQGCAFGVKVIIEGTVSGSYYGVHIHGNISQTPEGLGETKTRHEAAAPYFTHQFPYLKVGKTATVSSAADGSCNGIYVAGYGVVDIEGEVYGATGVYMKSGDVVCNGANIRSTFTGEAVFNWGTFGDGGTHGAGGSAIVAETSDAYAGGMGVTIQGDTKVTGSTGYAIFDQTTVTETIVDDVTTYSTTNHITIEGGTIESGTLGTIAVTQGAVDATSISGGNVEGTTVTISNPDVPGQTVTIPTTDFISEGTHTTTVQDGTKTIVVVSQGAALTDYAHVQGNAKDSVNWVGTGANATETLENNLTLKELEINQDWVQTLTIQNGTTLTVDRVVLGVNARIIVEAGGKFIVTGEQGIVAPKVSNILIKTSETAQGIFLFNPAVSSNRHPNATVEFKSKAYLNGTKGVFQRFGVPTWNRETKKTTMTSTGAAKTWITQYDYTTDDWAAWTAYDYDTEIEISDARPFCGYMLYSNNDKDHKMDYSFKGNLIGNQNENLHMYYGWNYFANSYTAPISIKDFINTVMASLDADKKDYILGTIYLYQNSGDDDYTWTGISLVSPEETWEIINNVPTLVPHQLTIQPMQAFLMRLNLIDGQMDQPISYKYDVYNPNMNISNNNTYLAPARQQEANNAMHVLVSGEGSWDKVYVVENDNFSSDLDNGYDAYKFDGNTGVSLYAMSADARMDILATDDAEGTFIGIKTPKAGNYTLHVAGVKGMEYAIVDMENNTVFEAVDGAKYEFYANAGVNDYRFQVVAVAKMPTAIENTEDIKKVNGVYTITGQFLGNDLNALPAGVYIVNGVKVVK